MPVAAREIRVAAHNRGIYRGRVLIATTALLSTTWILYAVFEFSGKASVAIGRQIFALQAWAAFIFACGAFTTTIDAISREKREGTLGLLFLTQLKGRDVILGKLVSGLSLFVAGAVATLPILTLPILLGGIQFSQSFYLLVSLLNTMLFSAAAGLFASSISINKAAGIAVSIVAFLCVLLPVFAGTGHKISLSPTTVHLLHLFTPVYAHQLASGAMTGLQVGYFWLSLAITSSMSCALLAAASWVTPRIWQERAKEPLLKRLTERHAAWTLRTIKSRSPLGRQLLDRNPYEWLASRKLAATANAWTFIGITVLLGAALVLNFSRNYEVANVLISICAPAAYILQVNIKVRIGGHACDRFAQDRESGALELLLCTPLTIREMIIAEFRALRRRFLLPLLAVSALLFVALSLSLQGIDRISQLFTQDGEQTFRWPAYLIILSAVFFVALDSITLAWAGVWCGLAARKGRQARGNAMTLVLAGPFILFCALFPLVMGNAALKSFLSEAGFNTSLILAVGFVTLFDLAIIYLARRWLLRRARHRLTNPEINTRDHKPLAWPPALASPFLPFRRPIRTASRR